MVQLGISYAMLAHYYPLDFNTNGGVFGKRTSKGCAAQENDKYANLPKGKVFQWCGKFLTGEENIDINKTGWVMLTHPVDADRVSSVQGSTNVSVSHNNPAILNSPVASPNPVVQQSTKLAKDLLAQNVSPYKSMEIMDELMEISDDKVPDKPDLSLSVISTTVAEIQAKSNELTYKASTKIAILNLVTECLNSRVLLQSKSTQNALNNAYNTTEAISDLASKLSTNSKIITILTEENRDLSNPFSTTSLLEELFKLTKSVTEWRIVFKNILKRIKHICEGVKEDLAHFPASHTRITSHNRDYQPLKGFQTWLLNDIADKIFKNNDHFQHWEESIEAVKKSGVDSLGKVGEAESITFSGLRHKRKADTISNPKAKHVRRS
ncbi:hypothetical protein MMC09_005592 [Bachmanniomyces sp. S44760]|nr:hypothetical protein [Bachmanniomyces sp. S44760]